MEDFPAEDSCVKRVGKMVLSGLLSGLFGVLVAEVVANSLVEISITPVFSIVFGAAFFVLGIAILYRVLQSLTEQDKRSIMVAFSILVFASSACSFLLERDWVPLPAVAKIPMYAIVGLSRSVALTFSFTEFINMGVCDRCCRTDFENNPIIGTKKQIFLIFAGAIIMGSVLGVMFGVIDVENDDQLHKKFNENLILSLPLGFVLGAIVGVINQFMRGAPELYTKFNNTSSHIDDI